MIEALVFHHYEDDFGDWEGGRGGGGEKEGERGEEEEEERVCHVEGRCDKERCSP